MLIKDLTQAKCFIYGSRKEQTIKLAEWALKEESLTYDRIDKRIDFIMQGKVIDTQSPPLTYCLQGLKVQIKGRCSVLPQICGVDTYLSYYSEKKNSVSWQKFSISVKMLYKIVKSQSKN